MVVCEKCGCENHYSTGSCARCGNKIEVTSAGMNAAQYLNNMHSNYQNTNSLYSNNYQYNYQYNNAQNICLNDYRKLTFNTIYYIWLYICAGSGIMGIISSILSSFVEALKTIEIGEYIVAVSIIGAIFSSISVVYDFITANNLSKGKKVGQVLTIVKTALNIVIGTVVLILSIMSFIAGATTTSYMGLEGFYIFFGIIGVCITFWKLASNIPILIYYIKKKKYFTN